ncbi:hypothetical protein [Mycobacterium szulgai]|uniref:Lipoprotein n=1 Tax=Mycobacterium szulgai TaxID=1787 RepID=A0A1X2E0G3_MYCSZ|nr:hypothetical protein [Mycobacterium szulgai]MCV7076954.1 hypothetical protein [Mycobacterium szulgai]ORW93834.1 hypothetical protein AWC27_08050 [Mycobacterium szulgai]
MSLRRHNTDGGIDMALCRTMMLIAAMSLAAGSAMTGCRAVTHADPPTFPDLTNYTPVNIGDYAIEIPNPGRGSSSEVFFLTPDGNACTLVNSGAECTGNNFPGIPAVSQDPPRGLAGVNGIRTDTGLQPTNAPVAGADNTVMGHPIRPLPPLHSIALNGAICGVDNAGSTACKDAQGRGFLISPQQGTVWLPHV